MTATTAITPFNFNNNDVRVIVQDGNPWFVAADVCAVLGVKNHRDSLMHLDDDEKGVVSNDTPGGKQQVSVVNESGLYALVLRSRKPEARKFTKWVTAEVLPSIRKTGQYTAYTVQPTDTLNEAQQIALRAMLESNVKRLPKEKQADAMIKGWSKLKAHFGVKYRQIPASEFTEALSIIARHVAEWELVDETAKQQEPQPTAFGQAMTAARENALHYFDAVRAGQANALLKDIPAKVLEGIVAESLMQHQFLAGFDYRTGQMQVRLVPRGSTMFDFQEGDFGIAVSAIPTKRLPDLQDALNRRIARHLEALAH